MGFTRRCAGSALAIVLVAGMAAGAFAAPPPVASKPNIAAPANVRTARSASDCMAHEPFGRAPLCATMLHPGNAFLVWDWRPGTGLAALDGYRVYRVDGGLKRLEATAPNKQAETIVELPLPAGGAGGYSGKCYAVSAFAGSMESALSEPFCAAVALAPTATPVPQQPTSPPKQSTPAPKAATPAATPAPTGTPQAGGLIALQRSRSTAVALPTPRPKLTAVDSTATRTAAAAQIALVAPANVHAASGPQECAAHVGAFGAMICPDMVKNGNVLLVWDWDGPASGPNAAIDGYRVYRVDSGLKQLADTVANKKDQTLSNVPKPAGGYSGKCYAAAAFAGVRESALSQAFCPAGGSAARTIVLSASHVRSVAKTRQNFSPPKNDNGLMVGFSYFADKELLGDNYSNRIHRSAFAFDLSALQNRRLVRATLRFTIAASYGDGIGNNHSCTTDVDAGTEFWWYDSGTWLTSAHDAGPNAGYQLVPGDTGPEISLDVTAVVRPWFTGSPNYGFVLKNADENLGAFTNKTCMSIYTNPTLELTYY